MSNGPELGPAPAGSESSVLAQEGLAAQAGAGRVAQLWARASRRSWGWTLALLALGAALLLLGTHVGSTGLDSLLPLNFWSEPLPRQIVLDIRLPRSLGAWLAGALLGLAGALAQGLFRNPLADPYLLGSASGASLGVTLALLLMSLLPTQSPLAPWLLQLGMTGAAFAGALAAVLLTLTLAQGVQHTLRLLLAGVVVGVVLGAFSSLLMLLRPQLLQTLQAFVLGTTGLLGWAACGQMAVTLLVGLLLAGMGSRVLDGLALGVATAHSLGLPVAGTRTLLVAVLALATASAVAHTGLIGFVGLAAPHLARSMQPGSQGRVVLLASLVGAALLCAADLLARGLLAPQELPVGVLTATLGGTYLLWRMRRYQAAQLS